MAKLVKSYSNHIIRKNPTPTPDGYIYETDMGTTIQQNELVGGILNARTSGGYGTMTSLLPNEQKDYNNIGWSENRYTLSNLDLTVADFQNNLINNTLSLKTNKNVTLNLNTDDLSQISYFGSLNAELKSSVDDIINRFPASLFIDEDNTTITTGKTITIPIAEIQNNFNIDIIDYGNTNVTYNLRTLDTSYSDYEITSIDGTVLSQITGFTGYIAESGNTITLNLTETLTGLTTTAYHIKPKETKRIEFFNSLDSFQKQLLNERTNPKYRSIFKVPTETDNGIEFEFVDFVWSTSDGYNLDIQSADYVYFMKTLIDATNFIDETFSDNLYRMLVHDTIKNMDLTYEKEIDEIRLEEIIVGGSKIQKVLRLYGRSFDELKDYSDGLLTVNKISYDVKNNIPREYLNSKQTQSGWESFSLLNTISSHEKTQDNLFPGISGSYNTIEIDDELTRRLILNTKNIFKSKGTRKSIRRLFNLFGVKEEWYQIREYVQPIDNFITGNTLDEIAALNDVIIRTSSPANEDMSEYEFTASESLYSNLNIGIKIKCPTCGSENYVVTGDTNASGICIEDNYLFSLTDGMIGYPKPVPNSNNYYFQQKGNWYRETGGIHTNLTGGTYVTEITTGNNPHAGYGEYDNGYDYINQFSDIFKRYVRGLTSNSTVGISGYTNQGFTISSRKIEDNTKVWCKNTTDRDTYNIRDENLVLNIKNFVIGFDGDKILQSFFENNNGVQKIGNTTGDYYEYIPEQHDSDYVLITNTSGTTYINWGGLMFSENKTIKIHNNLNGNGQNIIGDSGILIGSGETIIIKYDFNTSLFSWEKYNGEDEFELIKAITLPYIEQIIPSTTIFDFVLIDRENPKWLLVDNFCERNVSGSVNGNKIIVYQNINYFDETSTGVTQDLIDKIELDFGTGFTQYSINEMYLLTEEGGILLMEDDGYSVMDSGVITTGFDRIIAFKRANDENCDVDRTPTWEQIDVFE